MAVASNLLEHTETDENYPENRVTLPRIKNTLTGKIFAYVELIKMRLETFRDPQNRGWEKLPTLEWLVEYTQTEGAYLERD